MYNNKEFLNSIIVTRGIQGCSCIDTVANVQYDLEGLLRPLIRKGYLLAADLFINALFNRDRVMLHKLEIAGIYGLRIILESYICRRTLEMIRMWDSYSCNIIGEIFLYSLLQQGNTKITDEIEVISLGDTHELRSGSRLIASGLGNKIRLTLYNVFYLDDEKNTWVKIGNAPKESNLPLLPSDPIEGVTDISILI